jgi:hypothetical protein
MTDLQREGVAKPEPYDVVIRVGVGRSARRGADRHDGAPPLHSIRDAVLTHPTMAEGLNALFGNVPPL